MAITRRRFRPQPRRHAYSRVGGLPYALRILAGHAKTGQVVLSTTKGVKIDVLDSTPALLSTRRFSGLRSAVDAATQGSSERLVGTTASGATLEARGALSANRFTAATTAGATVDPRDKVYGCMMRFFAAFNNFDYGPFIISFGKVTNTAGTLDIAAANLIYRFMVQPSIYPFSLSLLSVSSAGNAFNVAVGDFGTVLAAGATSTLPTWKIESAGTATLLVNAQTLNQKDLSPMDHCTPQYLKDADDIIADDDFDIDELALDSDYYAGVN